MAKKTFQTAFESYEETETLGDGASGRVFRVAGSDGKSYALKLLTNAVIHQRKTGKYILSEEKRNRFRNEVFFCIKIAHQNVVRVRDYGFHLDNDMVIPFCVMPYYPQTLRTLMKDGIRPDKVLAYFAQILDGVEAAHLKEIWHRDLKPENIRFDKENDVLVVADFGIAHFQEEYLMSEVETGVAERLANFRYAAPEQKTRGGNVDHRSDIYALGLILNEMFTGEVIQGSNFTHVKDKIPQYEFLDAIVQKMISQQPAGRYDDIDQLKLDVMARYPELLVRQRIDDSTREVVPVARPDNPYVLTLQSMISVGSTGAFGTPAGSDPLETLYNKCLQLVQDRNKVEFNRLKTQATGSIAPVMTDWRGRYENRLPSSSEQRYEVIDDVVRLLGPLFIIPLAGLESEDPDFYQGGDILTDLLAVPDWQYVYSSLTYEFPHTLAFIFQSLYGAKSVATGHLERVFNMLTKARVMLAGEVKPESIWLRDEVMMHPMTISPEPHECWKYVDEAPDRLVWLRQAFGTSERYREALIAYNIALNIFELADLIAHQETPQVMDPDNRRLPRITPYFKFIVPATASRAVNLLTRHEDALACCWSYWGVTLGEMKKYWSQWMSKGREWGAGRYPRLSHRPLTHETILP